MVYLQQRAVRRAADGRLMASAAAAVLGREFVVQPEFLFDRRSVAPLQRSQYMVRPLTQNVHPPRASDLAVQQHVKNTSHWAPRASL
jgi:hypothetical protein